MQHQAAALSVAVSVFKVVADSEGTKASAAGSRVKAASVIANRAPTPPAKARKLVVVAGGDKDGEWKEF
jgi:hypothetical protein